MQRRRLLLLGRLNVLQGSDNRIRLWRGVSLVRQQRSQTADVRRRKIKRRKIKRQCTDGRRAIDGQSTYRQCQDRFPAGPLARCWSFRGFVLGFVFGLGFECCGGECCSVEVLGKAQRFGCRAHTHYLMSEQKEAVAGTSSRRLLYAAPTYNCLKLWAFWINSTLAARPSGMSSHPGRLRGLSDGICGACSTRPAKKAGDSPRERCRIRPNGGAACLKSPVSTRQASST